MLPGDRPSHPFCITGRIRGFASALKTFSAFPAPTAVVQPVGSTTTERLLSSYGKCHWEGEAGWARAHSELQALA